MKKIISACAIIYTALCVAAFVWSKHFTEKCFKQLERDLGA